MNMLKLCVIAATGLLMMSAATVDAAMLSGSFAAQPTNTTIDLTVHGNADWVKYSTAPGNSDVSRKADGTSAIGLGSGYSSNYGGGSSSNSELSWSGGTAPTTSGASLSGVTNIPSNGDGSSITLSIVSDGGPQELKLYLGNYQTYTTITAALPNATSYVDTSFDNANGAFVLHRIYTISFEADNPGDLLTFTLTRDQDNGGTTLVLQGASLQAEIVPEPSGFALMLGMFGALGFARGLFRGKK